MATTYAQPPLGPDTEPSPNPPNEPTGPTPSDAAEAAPAVPPDPSPAATAPPEPFEDRLWRAVVSRNDKAVTEVVTMEFERLREQHAIDTDLCVLGFYEPQQRIVGWQVDRIVSALKASNPLRAKDTLLVLRSPGGQISPAYQMAKTLRSLSRQRLIVAVPREAKSAATLIALGADEIHMGLLGELGPIDPQIDNLPALGVKRALETLTSLAQSQSSADMFANYLSRTVRIDQIGYYERVAESAVQYAERLLRTKPALADRANEIAKHLVYEYKDHGFVIDSEEATSAPLLLGDLIVTQSPIAAFSESVHELLEQANLFLWVHRPRRRLRLIGEFADGLWISADE
jgi:hypothetical protein